MSLQILPNLNSNKISSKLEYKNASAQTFMSNSAVPPEVKSDKPSNKLKAGVFLTTLSGVAITMAFVLKGKKLPFGKGLISATYQEKEIPLLVTKLAVGTVAGGLIGGAIFDKKENMNAKYRESIIQLVGNIFTPLICVWGGSKMFKKIEAPIVNKLTKFVKSETLKTVAKEAPAIIASTGSLIAGIFLGNKVGNTINKKAFKCDDERKIKLADMSPHIDDLCLALTLVASQSKIGFLKNIAPQLTKLIPIALMVAGVSTGLMQEKTKGLKPKDTEQANDVHQPKMIETSNPTGEVKATS